VRQQSEEVVHVTNRPWHPTSGDSWRCFQSFLEMPLAPFACLKNGLFDFFFQPEQCFSLITIQPEQCFSATFSQVSDQRTGPKARGRWFLFIQKWCLHIRMKWWYKYERICFLAWYTCATTRNGFWRLRWFIQALATVPMITRWSTVYAYAVHHRIIRWHCSPVSSYFPPLMMFMEWSVGWSFFSSFHPVNSILSLAKLTDHHRMNYCLLINRSCVWSGMRFYSFCARILTKLPASLGPICMHYDTK